MTTDPRRRVGALVILALAVTHGGVGPPAPLAQTVAYRLVTMTSGQGAGGPAADVSDSGIVVGYRFSVVGGYQWTEAAGLRPIGDATVQSQFPVFTSPELSVNDAGTIVGYGIDPNGGQGGAAKWSAASGYSLLGTGLAGQTAHGINTAGTIVGLYHGNASRPFIWREATGMQYLPGFALAGGSDAYDINDSDVVVGTAGGGTCGAGSSAFVWTESGGIVCLPKVHLEAAHAAAAISNNGRVLGRFLATANTPVGVFQWSAATGTIDLQLPASSSVLFMDVNDAGDVVVTTRPPAGGSNIPYLYRNGAWTNINTLLPAGSPVVLKSVTGINNSGWMVGEAALTSNPTGGGIGWLLIPPAATTTAVAATPNPSSFGTTTTFTATVQSGSTPVTSGTVTFREGSTVLAGPLALNAAGQATYATPALFAGTHTIEAAFSGSDGFLAGTGSVVHLVNALPPTSQDDHYGAPFESGLSTPAPGVLSNDASNGGGALAAVLQTTVAHGTLALDTNGGFTYTPDAGFVGTDTFTYRATNSVGTGNTVNVRVAVAHPTTAQPPTGLYVSSMRGNDVTFRWDPPAIGPGPEQFILTGGVLPGDVIATVPTGSAAPIFTVTAPNGAYYVRMHSFAAGGTSPPSNEIRIFVNTQTAPSAPADLVGLVDGSTLGLAWRNTYEGAAPTSLLLNVTGATVATIPMGVTESFAFSPVPGGTYTFAVRGVNAGGIGPPSAPQTLTFPGGCSGAPLAPARFLAYRLLSTIFVVWDPASSGPAPSQYVLHVTGSFAGDIPTASRALSGTVGPGTYTLTVRAANACGTSPATQPHTITVP